MTAPTQNQRHADIRFMDPLCRWCNILAIVPPYGYASKCDEAKRRSLYRWYTVFVFLLMTIVNAISIMGRFKYVYSTISPSATLIVTDLAVNFSTSATNLFTILAPSFWHVDAFKTFVEVFIKTDNCVFKDPLVIVKKCKTFYIEMVVGHIALMFMFAYDAYVWINGLGFTVYRNYLFRDFQTYHIYITVMVMYNFIVSIKYRFEVINNTLRRICNLPASGNSPTRLYVKMEKTHSYQIVRQIAQICEAQIMQITLFNKIFGWQILFLTFSIMMGLLNSLDLLTVYTFLGRGELLQTTMEYNLIVLSILWAIWQLLLGTVIAISCNRASKEAQQTADVCYSLILKLPVNAEGAHEKYLRDELLLLSQLVVNRCPPFSAAGFFSIDYSLLLAIFGSVTSYVIVIIQFNK